MGKRANIARTARATTMSEHYAQRADTMQYATLTHPQRIEVNHEFATSNFRRARTMLVMLTLKLTAVVAIFAGVFFGFPWFVGALILGGAAIRWILTRPAPRHPHAPSPGRHRAEQ